MVNELSCESDYEVPVTFDLEENNILQYIYKKVKLRYKKNVLLEQINVDHIKKEKAKKIYIK